VAVCAGDQHSIVVTKAGEAIIFGSMAYWQLGDNADGSKLFVLEELDAEQVMRHILKILMKS